jgi:hypothetical protein
MKKMQKMRMFGISVILLVFILMTNGCVDSEPYYPPVYHPKVGQFAVRNTYAPTTYFDQTIFFSLWDSKGEQFYNKQRVRAGTTYECGDFLEGTYIFIIYEYNSWDNKKPLEEVWYQGNLRIIGDRKNTFSY